MKRLLNHFQAAGAQSVAGRKMIDDILIGREKEINIISTLMYNNKNIIIFGEEGVGKTAVINKVLTDQFNSKKYLYSEKNKTFREALMGLVLSGSNSRGKIEEKNILALKKCSIPYWTKIRNI